MKKRRLGQTDLLVTELGLGGLFVSAVGGPFEQAREAVIRAIDLGVNYIDTAPGYRNSEEVLGRILHSEGLEKRVEDVSGGPLVLSTKLGGSPEPFEPKDATCLRRSVENSLALLHRDVIDILMIHEPDRPGQYDWWTDALRYDGPVMDVLSELKAEGTIRYTGLGGTTAYEIVPIIDTGKFDVLLTAFNYSPLWREAELEVLPAAKRQGMGVIIGSPLQQGALARRYDHEVEEGARWLSPPRRAQYRELYRFVDELGVTLPELGYRFAISNPDVSTVLMGARSAQEVEENVAAVEKGPLPAGVLTRLDEIAAMVQFRPFEEPFSLPFGREYRGPGRA